LGLGKLATSIGRASPAEPLDPVLHNKLLDLLRTYCAIGGLPAVSAKYLASRDLRGCQRLLDEIVLSFRDDFAKYAKKVPVSQLNEVFESVARQSGGKFKYTSVNPGLSHHEIKKALDLLVKAGLVHQVFHTDARGVPLGAQINPRRFKAMLFDLGVHQRLVNLDLASYLLQPGIDLVNKGPAAEIFVGLEMAANGPPYQHPALYYWHREARNSNAEVDYLCQRGAKPVPVEVKSGKRGGMQSMHLFLAERNLDRGIRLSLDNFGKYGAIDTMPLYAAGVVARQEHST
jgi:predicted AAA+ superfamily ATPase